MSFRYKIALTFIAFVGSVSLVALWTVLSYLENNFREELHPHVDEQPFTRSLRSVKIPAGVTSVIIPGYDKIHGAGGKSLKVTLPGR